ncbi:MAG: Pr6Pr family membrane protein [Ferruginibacter sp.]
MKNIFFGKTRQIFLANGAALGWIAIIFQLYLIIVNRTASVPETITRFFGYFTVLTNILVALCFTLLLLKPDSGWGRFFARPATLTALTVYIGVVGFIYNVILRFLWRPQGLQFVVDELLHSVIPVLFILYWFLFVPKKTLKWKNILSWMIYPAVYCIYSLVRGGIGGFYPYPFIDVGILGYNKVLFNVAGMIIVFLLLSIVLVGIGKMTKRPHSNNKL